MITQKDLEALEPGQYVWDEGKGSVSGFGARRQSGPAVSFILKHRTRDGRHRCPTIGRLGQPWTVHTARLEAKRLIGLIAAGQDPAGEKNDSRRAETVADLCAQYLDDAAQGLVTYRRKPKKPSTLATDRGRVERHIVPLLGHLKAAAVKPADVQGFYNAVARGRTAGAFKTGPRGLARVTGGKGTATRTLALLSAIFSYGIRHGILADNPCRHIEPHAYEKRERRLSPEEYAALGRALEATDIYPPALAAITLIALTGFRRSEAINLAWAELDLPHRTAILADTKTGKSIRPLSALALAHLEAQPRRGGLVFPSLGDGERAIQNINRIWQTIRKRASLPDEITPHVLRHSFASEAGDCGYSELTIAALIGHKKASITAGYVHHADQILLAAADAVAGRIADLLAGKEKKC